MRALNNSGFRQHQYPSKILQFGQGNFLRAFIGGRIENLNRYTQLNSGITIVRRNAAKIGHDLNEQDGLYTIIYRGVSEHAVADQVQEQYSQLVQSVNDCISIGSDFARFMSTAWDENYRFIVSNNTEMGIEFDDRCQLIDQPARTFPAKLTQWLYLRFQIFDGDSDRGVYVIPCELVDNNGTTLKAFIVKHAQQWGLSDDFVQWIKQACYFYDTLVDQIVTGYPPDIKVLERGLTYQDQHLVATELYSEFVIQGPDHIRSALCLDVYDKAVVSENAPALRLTIVDDVKPYTERKIHILNGTHSAMVPLALLMGLLTVRASILHPVVASYVQHFLEDEIIPQLPLPEDELLIYKNKTISRFENPAIEHRLMSIMLNSITKYRTRLVPMVQRYYNQRERVPAFLSLAFAGELVLLRGELLGKSIELSDDPELLGFVVIQWEKYKNGQVDSLAMVRSIFQSEAHWGFNMDLLDGWSLSVSKDIDSLLNRGVEATIKSLLVEQS